CGIGMVICVRAAAVAEATELLRAAGEQVYVIGEIAPKSGEHSVVVQHAPETTPA
ncbi:MAG: AIR synthase-related protein, partial [Pseudomonadota bacterium]